VVLSLNASLIIGNVAYAITAAAFVVRDILWLRLLSAFANAAFVAANIVAPAGPSYAFLIWSAIFLAINIFQIASLLLERRNVELATEDQDLHSAVFPHLPIGEFRLLLKIASRKEAPAGYILVEQGQNGTDVLVVESGLVTLERNGQPVGALAAGDMLGEMAFAGDRPFSSTAVVREPTKLIGWARKDLENLFARRPLIAIGFHAAFIGALKHSGNEVTQT
jgi:hypothetical protein